MKDVIRDFETGNVLVAGMRGSGKDMLFGNVVARRKKPYISNTDYGGQYIPFVPSEFDCGGNTFRNFLSGKIRQYIYPYPDGYDVYIGDAGIYFPSQYDSQIDKEFGYLSTYIALSRHTGAHNIHCNAQAIERIYKKMREQSDIFYVCNWCKVIAGKIVIQQVTRYEKYQSAVDRVPPFRLRCPILNRNRIQTWQIQKQNYLISHGVIRRRVLIYWNRAHYNTRIFKEVLSLAPPQNP